ncbi:Protein unc-93 A [Chamberlinius hualienensis]
MELKLEDGASVNDESKTSVESINGDVNFTISTETIADTKVKSKDEDIEKNAKTVRFRVWKNVVVLSIVWLFVYSGVSPMSSVQSSLNAGSGIGTLSLSIREGTKLVSSLLFNNFLIDKLGTKRMILVGSVLCSSYMVANFYPTWATMAPAGALYGFGLNSMWIAQNFYISRCADYYSTNVGVPRRTINVRLFGTFYGIYYWNHAVGNIASSLILGAASAKTQNFSYDPMELCGTQFCNEDLGVSFKSSFNGTTNSRRPDNSKVYGLCGFCVCAVLLGAAIALIFLDDLPSLGIVEKRDDDRSVWYLLSETFRHIRHLKILLLLPLFTYNGFDDSFIGTELTKAFVTCSIGVEYVGFVATLFGIFCPLAALACGWFNTPKTRFFPFILMAAAHLSCIIGMFYWTAESPTFYLYLVSAIWGIGSGVVGSQSSALCNVVYPDKLEPTISNLQVFAGIGGMFFFGISSVLCTSVKLYILSAFIVLGVTGVAIVEIMVHLENKKKKEAASSADLVKDAEKPAISS